MLITLLTNTINDILFFCSDDIVYDNTFSTPPFISIRRVNQIQSQELTFAGDNLNVKDSFTEIISDNNCTDGAALLYSMSGLRQLIIKPRTILLLV